jgi:hypothetical protein
MIRWRYPVTRIPFLIKVRNLAARDHFNRPGTLSFHSRATFCASAIWER